jgi:squalene cyclase
LDELKCMKLLSIPAKRVEQALFKGTRFLMAKRGSDGLWRDFQTLAGLSSDWVSGYIQAQFNQLKKYHSAVDLTHKTLMSRQRPNGGWSFNLRVPTDVDSTAWVLLAFSAIPYWRPSGRLRAISYIKRHVDPLTGGFCTYNEQDRVDRYIGADKTLTRGWLGAHTCVTSVVLQLMASTPKYWEKEIIRKAALFVKEQRLASFLWSSYWWQGQGYVTFHATKALLQTRILSYREAAKTIHAVMEKVNLSKYGKGSGSTETLFDMAYYLRTVLLRPQDNSIGALEGVVGYLLENQQRDGSWPSEPILRIPRPMVEQPETETNWRENELGTGVIIKDDNRLFTTASVLSSLLVYHRYLEHTAN